MGLATGARKRQRGEVHTLPSGSLRVRVYAGDDPLTGKRHYLVQVVPAGPNAAREAEKVRIRFINQVDERRSPRTKATVNQLLDKWLDVVEIEETTRRGYLSKIDTHIRPALGEIQVGRLDAETLESFYASLRKCRDRCGGRRRDKHRVKGAHECDAQCVVHACRPLAPATVRQIPAIIASALTRAVRWHWISVSPAAQAAKPAAPKPDPKPPTAEQAAAIVAEAWKDPDWGMLVWPRHGDTHQRRRIALDEQTVSLLRTYRATWVERAAMLDVDPLPDARIFSPAPDGSTWPKPDTMGQRYERMCARLGWDMNLHQLRHCSATELIAAGVDVRTVAGRLGHGGGGTTTLKVYSAWRSEADQRAAESLGSRMPMPPVPGPDVCWEGRSGPIRIGCESQRVLFSCASGE